MKLRYDRRILLLTVAAGLPGIVAALLLLWAGGYSTQTIVTAGLVMLVLWALAASSLRHRIVFPLADDGEPARGAARERFLVSRARRAGATIRSARRCSRSTRSPTRCATNGWDRSRRRRCCGR